jgi:hypothetical protein
MSRHRHGLLLLLLLQELLHPHQVLAVAQVPASLLLSQ